MRFNLQARSVALWVELDYERLNNLHGADLDEIKNLKSLSIVSWPSPQDYNEAVQNPAHCLADSSLGASVAETDGLGLPRPNTGMFASVYKMHCHDGDWALRCFLHFVPDQAERYAAISEALNEHKLESTVHFDLQERGILVHGQWFPVLKMQWCAGENLDQWLFLNLYNRPVLDKFLLDWKNVMVSFAVAGIAHGDLQHGNVLVSDGTIKIVDYDCMYVPALQGRLSNELGHRDYQHPQRSQHHFSAELDNFSAWVIYLSVEILSHDPEIWSQLHCGDDCLIWRQRDFKDPLHSLTFHVLEEHPIEAIRDAGRVMRLLLSLAPEQIPTLDKRPEIPVDMDGLEELLTPVATPFWIEATGLPAALDDDEWPGSDYDSGAKNQLGGTSGAKNSASGAGYYGPKRQRSRMKGGTTGWHKFAEPEPQVKVAEEEVVLSPLAQLVRSVASRGISKNSATGAGNTNQTSTSNSNTNTTNLGVANSSSSAALSTNTLPANSSGLPSAAAAEPPDHKWNSFLRKSVLSIIGIFGISMLFIIISSVSQASHSAQSILFEKGDSLLNANKFSEAESAYKTALSDLINAGPNFPGTAVLQGIATEKIGKAYLGERYYAEALSRFETAEQTFRTANNGQDSVELASVLGLKGRVYEMMGSLDTAYEYYGDSISMYQRLGIHPFFNADMASIMEAHSRSSLSRGG